MVSAEHLIGDYVVLEVSVGVPRVVADHVFATANEFVGDEVTALNAVGRVAVVMHRLCHLSDAHSSA